MTECKNTERQNTRNWMTEHQRTEHLSTECWSTEHGRTECQTAQTTERQITKHHL